MEKIAIDLTWVRHNKVGGTESCVRNLLDGFSLIKFPHYSFVLLLTKDNKESFEQYRSSSCFELYVCDINSANQRKRVIWQNFHLSGLLYRLGIKICLEPVYGKPFIGSKKIKYITTIHDLQAKHYPQYFSKGRVTWMMLSWRNAVRTSEKVIAISNFVKEDIIKTFNISDEKVQVIYDAVSIQTDNCADEECLNKYGLIKNEYYYTVSSLFLHKNLKTAILAMGELKKRESDAFKPFVISGIGGRKKDELDRIIAENDLANDIIFTSFVDDAERNLLYKNCRAFIFTSIFEGFGMPPIEAMAMGVPVVSSDKTSLREVTGGLCNYIEDPFNPKEWADIMETDLRPARETDVEALLNRYDKAAIAREYIELFNQLLV